MTTSSCVETNRPALAVYLADARRRVEAALDRFLPRVIDSPDSECPPRLAEAMRYSVLAGGKRLRPMLALMAAEACGADAEAAIPAACALEVIHSYSLIHDDLPCMDDDDLRRGRATCHKAFDEATAMLAGDGLLTLAFEIVARHTTPAQAAAECVSVLALAAGPLGMVGGQMSDLIAEGQPNATLPALESIHRRKTGALLKASLQMGAIVANAPGEQRRALDAYGRAVGLGFQIVDDLLDVEGDETKLGKRVGKDSNLGKWTYPSLLGVEGSRSRAHELAREAVSALEPFGDRAFRLAELAWNLLERDR